MTLNHNNKTVTNPVEIANIFNNHFALVAEKTKAFIHINSSLNNSFFLSPTNKNEILSIISTIIFIKF